MFIIKYCLITLVSKYHQEGFGSTTPELDSYNKQKKNLEEINLKMNKMINKMSSFLKENEDLLDSLKNVKISFLYLFKFSRRKTLII